MLLLLVTACCPVLPHAPSIDHFDVSAQGCGDWVGRASLTGAGELVVTADGKEVGRWTSPGNLDVEFHGTGRPGSPTKIHGSFGNAAVDRQLDLAPIDTPSLFVMSGDHELNVSINSSCDDVKWQTEVAVSPGGWVATRMLPSGSSTVALPTFPAGDYTATVRVVRGAETLAHDSATFSVGGGYTADVDADKDGQSPPMDCDDHNPDIGPMHAEAPQPNGKDDNCDGRVDEGTIVYDDDGDGLAEMAGDCDDADARQYPTAPELPNCVDDNCNNQVDEGVTVASIDDRYEGPSAYDLGGQNRATFPVEVVTRDVNDAEAFRLYAQDGLFDTFHVGLDVDGLPTGASYDVEILTDGGTLVASQRVSTEHTGAWYGGRGFHDDSGFYQVHIRPVRIPRAWCPVRLVIDAG